MCIQEKYWKLVYPIDPATCMFAFYPCIIENLSIHSQIA